MDYDIGADESVSTAIVRAVSAVDGRKPEFLPPLTRVLDPDAADALFGFQPDGTARTGGRISFVYDSCRVSIDNGEYLTVQPIEIRSQSRDERNATVSPHADEETERWSA